MAVPLTPKPAFSSYFRHREVAPRCLTGRGLETGTGRVRCRSYPFALGGSGYAHLRLLSLWRSTVGFDRLFDLVETASAPGEDNYPPYNIERLSDNRYQISLAVAGFSPDEISVTAEQNVVTIEGTRADKTEREYLYQGISARPLPATVQPGRLCSGEGAAFENGLLKIELSRKSRSHEAAANCHQWQAGSNVHRLESNAA